MRVQSWLLLADHFIDATAVAGVDTHSLALVVDERVVQVLLDLHRLQQTSHSAVRQDDVLLGVNDFDYDVGGCIGVFHILGG